MQPQQPNFNHTSIRFVSSTWSDLMNHPDGVTFGWLIERRTSEAVIDKGKKDARLTAPTSVAPLLIISKTGHLLSSRQPV